LIEETDSSLECVIEETDSRLECLIEETAVLNV
jgi:hypothetical protein